MSDEATRLLTWAIEDLGVACAVLDRQLAIVATTPSADALTGGALVRGISIVKALCGDAPDRPIAEALASGRPASGAIVRPGRDGVMRTLEVRASPIHRDGERVGWLVMFARPDDKGDAADAPILFHGMWTRDPGMKRIFHVVERAARRDVSVLVRGPTGSGKELIARALHELSPRQAGPFRAINCAALPPTLLESELFGHVRGAFTGALKDSPGYFRAAHHGTLFLDEVAEMPLDLQAKLLRVLETRSVIPIGGTEAIDVDVRVVAATHQSLRRAVELNRFRADLMYRLRVVPIFLPPLVARRGDLELLTDKLIEQLNAEGERRITQVSRAAREAIAGYPWPGNVRELRNALQYAYVIGDGPILLDVELPPEVSGMAFDPDSTPVNARPSEAGSDDETPETRRIRLALAHADGNRERAAQILGMSRVTLWRRMKTLGLLAAEEPSPPDRDG
ncbi:MAG TPA: sigma 54-interacting transcriptional regulator [Kofleriaceae bacterium]|nr:sigma 54-interacting transcriptional regulator [Kofleriaceae bacterium]